MDKKQKIKKVIQIIWNIVSVIFVAFVSGALIINAIKGADEKTQDIVTPNIQEEYKVKRNSMINDWYLFTSADFGNGFISRLYFSPNFDSTDRSLMWTTASYSRQFPLGDGDLIKYCPTSQLYYNDLSQSQFSGSVSYVSIMSRSTSSSTEGLGNGCLVKPYWCAIYDSNNDIVMRIPFWAFCPLGDNGEYKTDYAFFSIDKTNTSSLVYFNYNAIVCPSTALTFLSYVVGERSYQQGYEFGFKTGYNQGLVKGAEGIESSAFDVIGRAFSAVGDIFSIEVLPSLPLWLLVFTPLIIAVVIVVVKMIKG